MRSHDPITQAALVIFFLAFAPVASYATTFSGTFSNTYSGSSQGSQFDNITIPGFSSLDSGLTNPLLTGVSVTDVSSTFQFDGTQPTTACPIALCEFTVSETVGFADSANPNGDLVAQSTASSNTSTSFSESLGESYFSFSGSGTYYFGTTTLPVSDPQYMNSWQFSDYTSPEAISYKIGSNSFTGTIPTITALSDKVKVVYSYTATLPATVPDPATPALVALGLLGLPLCRRRARKVSDPRTDA